MGRLLQRDARHPSHGRELSLASQAPPIHSRDGLALSSAFQAAGRPLWPLLGIASRVLVVGAGGWVVIHMTDAGLVGLAFVTAAGLIVYGAIVAIAFRAGTWRARWRWIPMMVRPASDQPNEHDTSTIPRRRCNACDLLARPRSAGCSSPSSLDFARSPAMAISIMLKLKAPAPTAP